jgi:invasion protein IalB
VHLETIRLKRLTHRTRRVSGYSSILFDEGHITMLITLAAHGSMKRSFLKIALACTTLIASPVAAWAQTAPKPNAAAPAAPTGPTIVQVKPEPSQPEWTKVCGSDPANSKEICYTTRDFISDQGQPVLAVAIYDVKGDPQKIVRFLMPLGLLLTPGIRFGVDQAQPVAGKYQICFPNGCFAEAQVKEDTINALKKGTNLNVSVQNQVAKEVTFQIPLTGFGKAFDGPAIDPKVLQEQQEKLKAQLEKMGEEQRKKTEGAAPAPATPPKP